MKNRMVISISQIGIVALVLLVLVSSFFLISFRGGGLKYVPKSNIVSFVKHPEWSKNAVIYEVNVRQYTPEGTFAAFYEHLPRLKEMGVDILWFMPIHPIGEKNRKGTLGSYYSVKDYKGVNPEFGNMDDFKRIVNRAHELGMYVILDWVANHTAWDHQWVYDYPEWYTKDSLDKMVSPFDWSDVADLNYDNEELRKAMLDALKYWVIEAGIDGYRCDVAGMVPTDFWEEVREELDSIKPVFMLAEAEEPEHHIRAFDMSYAWEMHHVMNKIAKGELKPRALDSIIAKHDTLFPENAYRMQFITNHDENSWNGTEFERMGDGVEAFAVLTFTLPGMPLIYSGQEAALDERLKFFEKDTIDWKDYPMEDFYADLISLKKKNPALWNGEFGGEYKKIKTNADKSIFAFIREKDRNRILVLLNLSDTDVGFKLKGESFTGNYISMREGKGITFRKNHESRLSPWEVKIFISE